MAKKVYNAKEIIKTITSGNMTLEEILTNNILIQSDVVPKFGKMTSYFITENIINKLINYCLVVQEENENWKTMAHNACEILSQVKNTELYDKLTIEEELPSSDDEEEEEEEYESGEEENEEASSNQSNDAVDFIEFKEIDTKGMDKEIKYGSPLRNSRKFTKKPTIKANAFFNKQFEPKKDAKKTFPYLDRLFSFVKGKKLEVEEILSVVNEKNKSLMLLNNDTNKSITLVDISSKDQVNESRELNTQNSNRSVKSENSYGSVKKHHGKDGKQEDVIISNTKNTNEKGSINNSIHDDSNHNHNNNNNNNNNINYTGIDILSIPKDDSKFIVSEDNDKSSPVKTSKKFQISNDTTTLKNKLKVYSNSSFIQIYEAIEEITNDLLSGYFLRIFSNLILNRKAKVSLKNANHLLICHFTCTCLY